MRVGARTRVIALLGDPVAHSLSPLFQNAGFRAAGLDAVYVALRVDAARVAATIGAIAASGGGGNITIPHKSAAMVPGVHPDAQAAALGVANVFVGDAEGAAHVGNTDVAGVLAGLDAIGAAGEAWCLAGTGGSARAVVGAARSRGARLAVASRDPARAEAFLAWAAGLGVASAAFEECTVAINATPLGLTEGDAPPIDRAALPALRAGLDLTYRRGGPTAWVAELRRAGLAAADGREVLLAQGAASWAWWFPGVEPPLEVMRAALDGRLV